MTPARPSLVRSLLRWASLLAFVCGMTWGGFARAETGRPSGWAVERASEHLQVGKVSVRFDPALQSDAEAIVEQLPVVWSTIEGRLGADVDDALDIILVTHAGQVARASGMPTWAAGVAHPPSGRILVAQHGPDGSPTDMLGVLEHEMVHVGLHRAAGERSLPRWFQEGVAESLEGGISFARAQTLAGAVFGPGVPDLDALESMFRGDDPRAASVAYAAARDFVGFLVAYEGGTPFRQVITELKLGHAFEAAFVRAYQASLVELVREWRTGLPGKFVWYSLTASGGLPFAVLLPLIMLAYLRRRRVLNAAWQRLRDDDEAELANFGLAAARSV